MPTTAALALKGQEALLAESISSFFAECDDEADATARAMVLSTFGRVDALKFARTQDEFEATFELLSRRRILLEFNRLFNDERVLRLIRHAQACDVAGHAPIVKDARAAELGDDLGERYGLLVGLLMETKPTGKPPTVVYESLAAWTIAAAALRMAAYAPEQWSPWMVGMLWNFGRRALVDIAHAAEIPWERAIDGLTTNRDRRFLEQPFNERASAEASMLLGLQQAPGDGMAFTVRYGPGVLDRLSSLSKRDLAVVRDNVISIRDNPRGFSNHPSGLRQARFKAWQHKCPHSWVVLFRWAGGDESHPNNVITIEDLVECY